MLIELRVAFALPRRTGQVRPKAVGGIVLQVSVECQNMAGEWFPTRFGWPDAMRDVLHVDDWWPGEDHCYFRVRASDGGTYILRHDQPAQAWEVVVFQWPVPNTQVQSLRPQLN